MKKADIIKAVLAVQNLHSEEDLKKLTIPKLKKLAKDFSVSLEETPKEETPKEETPENDLLDGEEIEDFIKSEFSSFCGLDFDPNKSSSCNLDCKADNPDEYAKCLENFKSSDVKPKSTAAKKDLVGKNIWGRRLGSQADLIEQILFGDHFLTIKEIAKSSGCTISRVKRHFLRLIYKEAGTRDTEDGENKGEVRITAEGLVFLSWRFPEMKGELAYQKRTVVEPPKETTQKETPKTEVAA